MPTATLSHLHYFARIDRMRHVLVVGKTGTGKSTLLRTLARHDLAAGRGLLLIDPHGDLAQQVRGDVPRSRKNDLVVFDPRDARCPGLNPLRAADETTKPLLVSGILATIRKLFDRDLWGPRAEHILRHVLLSLVGVRGATFADAAAILVDERHRQWALRQVTDAHVTAFWTREFASLGKSFAAEVTAPVLNKLGALLASSLVRAVVTRSRPRLDAERALARARIVIADLPKGAIGEDAALFLGGLVIGAFQLATLARSSIPSTERRPFSIMVDEMGSFAATPLLELLAEGRKYGVGLVLATQSLSALPADVRAAILANVGTIVTFRVGADDAEILGGEFAFEYGAKTLTGLQTGEVVVRVGPERPRILTVPPIA